MRINFLSHCVRGGLLLLAATFAQQAQATLIVVKTPGATQNTFNADVSAVDQGNAGSAVLVSRTEGGTYTPFTVGPDTSSADNLNNGAVGSTTGSTNPDLKDVAFDIDGTWTSTFLFDTVANPLGYTITQIATFSAWSDTRTNQQYQIQYTDVSDNLFTLTGVIDAPGGVVSYLPNQNFNNSTRITLTEDGGVPSLTGVKSLIFNIQSVGSVYREIDVFAVPVPEPSGLVLLMVGSVAMWLFKGRREA